MDNARRPTNLTPGTYRFDEFFYERIYGADGYYKNGNGVSIDFDTHVSKDPTFHKRVLSWVETKWRSLGEPNDLFIYELGSGDGTLCKQILSSDVTCKEAIRYVAVEPNTMFHDKYPNEVQVVSCMPENPGAGLVLGCSVLNSLPVRFVSCRDGEWQELYVSVDANIATVEWRAVTESLPKTVVLCGDKNGSVPWVEYSAKFLTETFKSFTGHAAFVEWFCLKTSDLPGSNWIVSMKNFMPVPTLDLSVVASIASVTPVDQIEELFCAGRLVDQASWFADEPSVSDGFSVLEWEFVGGKPK